MFKLVLVCTLAAVAFADVSHLVRNRRPFGFAPAAPRPTFAAPARVVPVAPRVVPVVPISSGRQIAILRQESDIQPDGSYQYSYETENGIAGEERAQIRVLSAEEADKSAQGSFRWTSPEGEQISVSYIADADGYQPQGSHLPVAPPVPAAIQRALDWIAAHPQPAERQQSYTPQRRF